MPSSLERLLEPYCQASGHPGEPGRAAFYVAFSIIYGYIGTAAWETRKTRKIQLADALKISPATLQRWVDGKTAPHRLARPAALRTAIRTVLTFS